MTKAPLKVLIFVVTYHAAKHIAETLARIPFDELTADRYAVDVLIIDDASSDDTAAIAKTLAASERYAGHAITVLRNEVNQGYGGNQKLGYAHAIAHGYDVVALLHGDGQYDPACLPRLLEPFLRGQADAVFGSRMLVKGDARRGGMPYYKFIGNKLLTMIQNRVLGAQLSEFHSGYRLYTTAALKRISFQHNSNDFEFDTDIIIQLLDTHQRIHEEPIPTFYGDEICYVNGPKYACKILKSTLCSRLQKRGLYYHLRFDYK